MLMPSWYDYIRLTLAGQKLEVNTLPKFTIELRSVTCENNAW